MTPATIHGRGFEIGALYATRDNRPVRYRLLGYGIGHVTPDLDAPAGLVRYREEPGGRAYSTDAAWWVGMAGERVDG